MGRYIDWENCVDRYPELDDLGGADELSSSYIVYAEAFVDGVLKSHFATPFSDTNLTVKNLCIDHVFWNAGRHKLDDAIEVKSSFFESIDALKNRRMVMVDASGETIEAQDIAAGLWSSTQSYHGAFGMADPLDWKVDSDQAGAYRDETL